jgi:hypothetical protein
LIYNAALADAFPVLPHPLAVIEPNVGIFQVSPVRFPQLLPPASLPALIATIALTSIAPPADEEHQTAIDCPAK